jgi:YfiH family protein
MAPALLRVPAWAQHPWLHAAFSTRHSGLSTAYGPAELNLGTTADDAPQNVAANRAALLKTVAPGFDLVTLAQIHSDTTHRIDTAPANNLRGDGLLTRQPNLLLGILTADCVPILLADTRTHAVAAFHAGWRGTVAQIVEQGVATLLSEGSHPADLTAAIGPAIARCCFAIGDEVLTSFQARFAYAGDLFHQQDGQPHGDLHEANRRQLLAAGLRPEAITVLAECTACTRLPNGQRKYFSHRSEHGKTGRMMSVIGASA